MDHIKAVDRDESLPNFIKDEAADEDAFGSHTLIAKAIATVIQYRPDLKVIGLLGPWGSGKSTVIKRVESDLKADISKATYCFSYDAWLHQNDPPKRSFLETLVYYLIKEVPEAKKFSGVWTEKLDKLNGRIDEFETKSTPTLTNSGRWLVLSLLAVPFGAQFVSHDWYSKMSTVGATLIERWAFWTGVLLMFLPLEVAFIVYILWRDIKLLGSWNFFPSTVRHIKMNPFFRSL